MYGVASPSGCICCRAARAASASPAPGACAREQLQGGEAGEHAAFVEAPEDALGSLGRRRDVTLLLVELAEADHGVRKRGAPT